MKVKAAGITACTLIICCGIVHRRVIKSMITGKDMPKAPKWHIWVDADKRRD
jgi:hypothetical protein